MQSNIDELNTPEYEAISYEDYFAPMDIPEEDKEKRVEMAEEIDDVYYEFFAMIATMVATQQYLDWDYLNDYLNTRLYDTFEDYEYSATRDYLQRYVDLSASNTVTTTLDHQGEEYYLSDERASRLAAENAQTIANYTELQDAILAGFTHKTWKAELTKATRKDHREMNGKTIHIEEYFKFPDCQGLCPHDEVNLTPRQTANCRCALLYSNIPDSDDENSANYKAVVLGEEAIETVSATESTVDIIKSRPLIDSQNKLYISEKLDIAPRKLHEIETYITKSKNKIGLEGKTEPRIILVDTTELEGSYGRFNARTNTIYYKVIGDKAEQKISIAHELYHWDDAQRYILNGGKIVSNKQFYETMSKASKPILDKMGVTADNVVKISDYAADMYELGKFDEVLVEYKAVRDIRGKIKW